MLMPDAPLPRDLHEYSPLVLAYIGDAVYELMVRTHIVAQGKRRMQAIHLNTVDLVRAENQARFIRQIENQLTPEERDVVRRGRNTRSSPPKNADPQAYRMSTGFEALLGYLYLQGDEERLRFLVQQAWKDE
jgi:ribonuclease III family protein